MAKKLTDLRKVLILEGLIGATRRASLEFDGVDEDGNRYGVYEIARDYVIQNLREFLWERRA